MRIVNFGSLNIDTVFSVDHSAAPGESMPVRDPQTFAGGKGLNQSIAAARAGGAVWHAGRIGPDGVFLTDLLTKDGVDTSFVLLDQDAKSGGAIIQVEPNARNTMLIYGGANRRLTEEQVDAVLQNFSAGDFLILQNETNLTRRMIEIAFDKGIRIVYNPSPITPDLFEMPFEKVDLLIVNEDEGAALAGGTYEPEEMLRRLHDVCPNIVILTLGKDGSYAMENGELIHQEIFPVEAVDSTGAGDTYAGYITAGLDRGESLRDAMRMAAAASAIAVSRNGAAASIPTLEETKAFLAKQN